MDNTQSQNQVPVAQPAGGQPVQSGAVPVAGRTQAAPQGGSPGKGQQTVLLVEDDQFLSSLLKNKLEEAGIYVQLATDGDQALQILNSFRPTLVLLDLILPGRSGFEVLSSIHGNPQLAGIPVIILSNLGQESDVAKGQELGAVEYYIKAKTSVDELVKRVAEFLVNKGQVSG